MTGFRCVRRVGGFPLLASSIALLLALAAGLHAADWFPGAEWEEASPEAIGWSAERLSEARAYADTLDTAAVMVVHQGGVVVRWGETERPFECHSIRKSLLSALYGMQVAEGTIDLDGTLEQLGIDDNEPSLTEAERKATVRDLLKARSGVYHPALYETDRMKARRPERWSREPGTFWYYNNWDFNALGTIFENWTARSLFEEFEERIARPLGMQDFDRRRHTRYVTGRDSVHRAYPFRLSARDLARFGLLFARGGRWNGSPIVPEEWVAESTTSYSDAGGSGGYGYMWWVAQNGKHYPGVELPDGTFSARGRGGHCIVVIPQWDLVVVHRVNTFRRGDAVSSQEFGRLLSMILSAMPEEATAEDVAEGPSDSQNGEPEADDGPNAPPPARPQSRFDLLLKNGRVMDGTGNPWFQADVAVRDGRIAAVGRFDSNTAVRTIDVSGKVVAPGFIDLHSHAERGLTSGNAERRAAPNLVSQGITTVVVNQDGFGPASLEGQLEVFQRRGIGPNAILLIGHGAIRRAAMNGDFRRSATEAEVERMRRLLREAIELGAFGMSAGLEYVPGRWSTTDEIKALVGEVAQADGVYVVHERSSGANPMWYLPSRDGPDPSSMIDNILELINVGQATGAKVVATHIKARGADFWGSSRPIIQLIEDARRLGVRIYADQYPYNTSGSDGRVVLIPDWLPQRVAAARKAEDDDTDADSEAKSDEDAAHRDAEEDRRPTPAEALEEALRDEQLAADLRQDIQHEITRRGGPRQIIIMDHPGEKLIGISLAEAAGQQSISPVEMAIRLQLDGRRDQPGGARLRAYSMSEIDVEAFAQQRWTATCSDAGIALPTDDGPVHPRYYGTFPRKIRRYAIERGVMTVEDAIRSSTSLPAQILGLRDRGQVREGFHADLVVLDLDRIRDKATAEEPHQYSEGIEYVLIGGTFVVEAGKLTGALPGQVVRPSRQATNKQ